LLSQPWCQALARQLRGHLVLATCLPTGTVAVQCSYFEKSAELNWRVPPHQDIGIPVASRVDHPALGGWSEKEGVLHVNAPADLLGQLWAVRLHLDDCSAIDGALRVLPGSHREGILSPDREAVLRRAVAEVTCPVPQGGAMVMSPLLLHASSKATGSSRRRVLHFLFGPSGAGLPMGFRSPLEA